MVDVWTWKYTGIKTTDSTILPERRRLTVFGRFYDEKDLTKLTKILTIKILITWYSRVGGGLRHDSAQNRKHYIGLQYWITVKGRSEIIVQPGSWEELRCDSLLWKDVWKDNVQTFIIYEKYPPNRMIAYAVWPVEYGTIWITFE